MTASARWPVASTGIAGLDDVLRGGLPRDRLYLIEGDPGVGKTTLALQFLAQGARQGERVLYITLSETEEEIRAVASSHGFELTGIDLYELSAAEQQLSFDQNTLFPASEVELREITQTLLQQVERIQPNRVVFDSLSEIRLLSQDALRYRRQILALKQFFSGRRCTVLLLDDRTSGAHDQQLQSLVHGVIALEKLSPEYGGERRRVSITKLRGVQFRGGFHDYIIERGGLVVFPRLVAAEHRADITGEKISTGVAALDTLLGGGLTQGTSTLIMGPAGSGKSTVALQIVIAAAQRGERSHVYLFEESLRTVSDRTARLGIPVAPHLASGMIRITQVDPAELAPGEFAHLVRAAVDDHDVKLIVIDGLNGYMNAMPEERFVTLHTRELLSFLNQRGVATVLVYSQHGLVGMMQQSVDISYLTDTVMVIRYFEAMGAVHKALSVMKNRAASHESTIREFSLGAGGLSVGAPLKDFQGVLSGTPRYVGPSSILAKDGDEHHKS
ncbi:MAG TPA: ATPase domain-containing protein [Terriglobales bacterium]|nr:ATPase domain-containing protein [Terriglobales bacterium]